MSFPFDATMKDMVRRNPTECGKAFGGDNRPARMLNVDLSTLSAAKDAALGFGEPVEEILDINFQSGADPFLSARTEMYRAVLHHHHHVPVRSLIVLLRPAADHAHLTGNHTTGGETNGVICTYQVLRLSNEPPKRFLHSGVGLLPLATLCRFPDNVTAEQALAEIVGIIDTRLLTEVPEAERLHILTGAYTRSGLRVKRSSLAKIFGGHGMVKHTNAYDEMLYEGALRALRESILRQGNRKFGAGSDEQQSHLAQIEDDEQLTRILDAVPQAKNWEELLATP